MTTQKIYAFCQTHRKGLGKRIVGMFRFVGTFQAIFGSKAQESVLAQFCCFGQRVLTPQYLNCNCLVFMLLNVLVKILKKRHGFTVQTYHLIAFLQPRFLGGFARNDLAHDVQHGQRKELFFLVFVPCHHVNRAFGNRQRHFLTASFDFEWLDSRKNDFSQNGSIVEFVKRFLPNFNDFIARLETNFLPQWVGINTKFSVFGGQIIFAVVPNQAAKNQKTQNEIHGHATEHNNKALPRFFGAKFPRLRGLFHLLFVHAFVHHAADFDVTAQRQPTNSVFRITNFFLEKGEIRVKK